MFFEFNQQGNLLEGIHWANWQDLAKQCATNKHRKKLLAGLKQVAANLEAAGCKTLYVGGSFVTTKEFPNDFDGCWSVVGVNFDSVDPVVLDQNDLENGRKKQKAKFGGELFPAEMIEGSSGKPFLEFFQTDRDGKAKGIVGIKLKPATPRKKKT